MTLIPIALYDNLLRVAANGYSLLTIVMLAGYYRYRSLGVPIVTGMSGYIFDITIFNGIYVFLPRRFI